MAIVRYALLSVVGLSVVPESALTTVQATWDLVPEETITRMSEGTPGRAWDLARDEEGRTYIAGVRGIHVFSEDGEALEPIGSRGAPDSQEPGTYGIAEAIGVRNGHVWVADGSSRRIHFFNTDGAPLDHWTEISSPPSVRAQMHLRPLGALGARKAIFVEWPDDLGMFGDIREPLRLFLTNASGQSLEELGSVDARTALLVATAEGGYRHLRRQPFSFSNLVATDPYTRRFALIRRPVPQTPGSAYYAVTVFGTDGTELWTTRRSYRPTRLTDEIFDLWIDSVSTGRDADRPPDFYRGLYRRHVFRPEFFPPIPNDVPGIISGSIAFGRDGSVWVERTTREDETAWDVFDAGGEPVATARGPADIQLIVIDDATALGIRHEEREGDDRQSVVRLSVHEGP